MSYVPIVPSPPSPPSHQTRELADRLSQVILEYERSHPSLTGPEVREAVQIALRASRTSRSVAPVLAVTAGLGVLAAVLFGLFAAGGVALDGFAVPWVAVGVLAGLIVLVIAALRRSP